MNRDLARRLGRLEGTDGYRPLVLFFLDADREEARRAVAEVVAEVGPHRGLIVVDIDARWPPRDAQQGPCGLH